MGLSQSGAPVVIPDRISLFTTPEQVVAFIARRLKTWEELEAEGEDIHDVDAANTGVVDDLVEVCREIDARPS